MSINHSEESRKVPSRWIDRLEDKQFDLALDARREAAAVCRKRALWPTLAAMAGGSPFVAAVLYRPNLALIAVTACCLAVSAGLWWRWRSRLPEQVRLAAIDAEVKRLEGSRSRRVWWRRLWKGRNKLVSASFESINRFYTTLIRTALLYNTRQDLLQYALDRQNKSLDAPFTVTELEQITATFKRIFDELSSAERLLELAEKNPQMDLAELLRDQYDGEKGSAGYISDSSELTANSGRIVADLLNLEAELKRDIDRLSGAYEADER